MNEYDVIIVGAGAAGLTAAMYTTRQNLRTLVLSQDIGGQASTTARIENYPGVDPIDGLELMMKFRRQAETSGATVVLDEVTGVLPDGDAFTVNARSKSYHGKAIIFAHGLTHKHLNVPGEEALIGKGVSYCASCDAPLFKGKKVAVVGGGNAAMDAALMLANICPQVTVLTVNPELRGEGVLINRVAAAANITVATSVKVLSVRGEDHVEELAYEHNGQAQAVQVDGVFVEIGYTVNPALMKDIVALDQRNQIVINHEDNGTNIPGIFAAGDVTTIRNKQIVISAGEGAKAALGVTAYLQRRGDTPVAPIDWGRSVPMRSQIATTS